ncbi:hypothetical protein PENTCL1PPCAC_26317, partial [Pristionchus entomophagus]
MFTHAWTGKSAGDSSSRLLRWNLLYDVVWDSRHSKGLSLPIPHWRELSVEKTNGVSLVAAFPGTEVAPTIRPGWQHPRHRLCSASMEAGRNGRARTATPASVRISPEASVSLSRTECARIPPHPTEDQSALEVLPELSSVTDPVAHRPTLLMSSSRKSAWNTSDSRTTRNSLEQSTHPIPSKSVQG